MEDRRDLNDNILGPEYTAFEMRPTEDFLSVTWCEYFDADDQSQLRCAIEAIRRSNFEVKKSACFCVANTTDVLVAIVQSGRTGRAVYLPERDNPAHAGIYGFSPEDVLLSSQLAEEVWRNFLTKADADALPLSGCSKSADVDDTV